MQILEGSEAPAIAKRRARYSDFDWIAWVDRDGIWRAARASAEVVKMAMLATGTQGKIYQYQSRTGWSHMMSWGRANNVRRQLLRGWY